MANHNNGANLGFESELWRAADATEQSAKLDQLIWANLEDIGYGQ